MCLTLSIGILAGTYSFLEMLCHKNSNKKRANTRTRNLLRYLRVIMEHIFGKLCPSVPINVSFHIVSIYIYQKNN